MAKKQDRKSRRSAAKTEPVVGAKDETAATAPSRRKMMAGRKGLRRRLHKLEGQLADAARQERKRLRRLERALWRRQRIEAAIDEIKTATALIKNAAAADSVKPAEAKPAATAAADVKPAAVPKPVAANPVAVKPVARRPAARSAAPKPAVAAKPAARRPAARSAAKSAAPVSTQEAATVAAETPAPTAPVRPARTRRAPVKRAAQPRSNGAAGSPRPAIKAEPTPVPPTQS
jgi:hypothetical protein